MLKKLAEIPQALHYLPLAEAIGEHLMRQRKRKRWRWSTTLKYMACAQGALSSLPLYRHTPHPILLKQSVVWMQAMRACGRQARQELPKQPTPATWTQVQRVLRREASLPVFAAVLLAWLSAARVGCVLQLAASDLEIHPDGTTSIRFRRGKSVLARGTAYTVHTPPIPAEFLPRLRRWLDQRKSTLFPSSVKGQHIKESLRTEDKALEQRSLRRGALQSLAAQPDMTDEVLMLFSGHASVNTLRRYLSWGTRALHTRAKMVSAAGTSLTAAPAQPRRGG